MGKLEKEKLHCPYLRTTYITIEMEDRIMKDPRATVMFTQGLIVRIVDAEDEPTVTELTLNEKKELCAVGAPFPDFGVYNGQYFWVSYQAISNLGKERVLNDLPKFLNEERENEFNWRKSHVS